MEQFISEIEAAAKRLGITPNKLLRQAINAKWSQFDDWKHGRASPTMAVVERVRCHIAALPPEAS